MTSRRYPSRASKDAQRAAWMRRYQTAAYDAGASPVNFDWNTPNHLYNEGLSPEEAAERVYKRSSDRSRDRSTKIIASSKDRYRASAAERRLYGGSTVTQFYVYRAEDRNDASRWRIVTGYGKTPGERKTDAIRRSGFLDEPERDRRRAGRSRS